MSNALSRSVQPFSFRFSSSSHLMSCCSLVFADYSQACAAHGTARGGLHHGGRPLLGPLHRAPPRPPPHMQHATVPPAPARRATGSHQSPLSSCSAHGGAGGGRLTALGGHARGQQQQHSAERPHGRCTLPHNARSCVVWQRRSVPQSGPTAARGNFFGKEHKKKKGRVSDYEC